MSLDTIFTRNIDQCGGCKCSYGRQVDGQPADLRCWRSGKPAHVRCPNFIPDEMHHPSIKEQAEQ